MGPQGAPLGGATEHRMARACSVPARRPTPTPSSSQPPPDSRSTTRCYARSTARNSSASRLASQGRAAGARGWANAVAVVAHGRRPCDPRARRAERRRHAGADLDRRRAGLPHLTVDHRAAKNTSTRSRSIPKSTTPSWPPTAPSLRIGEFTRAAATNPIRLQIYLRKPGQRIPRDIRSLEIRRKIAYWGYQTKQIQNLRAQSRNRSQK